MDPKPINLTKTGMAVLNLLGRKRLATITTFQERLRGLDEFQEIFLNSVLAENGITEGEYAVDLEGCQLVPKIKEAQP